MSIIMESPSQLPPQKMPKGFDEDDFNFSKLYKCVNLVGQNTMCEVVREMYSHASVESNNGSMPLNDYFINSREWSNTKLKEEVTKLHRSLLNVNLNTEDFDISFAYMVMTKGCPNLYNDLTEKCRENIEELKKMRNKICHKYGVQADELPREVEKLRNILVEIYEGVGKVVGKDFLKNIENMKQNLESILSAKVRQEDMETYLQDVRIFRESRKFKMINDGKVEFRHFYDNLQILNPCTWMTEEQFNKTSLSKYQIEKIFTPLKIEDSRKKIDMSELFTVTKRLRGVERVPPALLLHGLAGCGKTSLCHFLIHQWCKEDSDVDGLKDFDLVIFVEIRRVRSKTLSDFLIQECKMEVCKSFKSDDVIPTLQDIDVLIVIDGFDEAKNDSLELVDDIFNKFNTQRILLTTRPELQTDAEYLARKFRVGYLSIQICGFDDERLKLFSAKVFKAVESDEKKCQEQILKFHEYIDGPGRILDEHLKLPLTLALLIYLWKDDPTIVNKVTTATQLYFELFKLCQKKLKERLQYHGRDNLDRILDELLLCLGEQAWCLLLEGNLICLTKKECDKLEQECTKRMVRKIELMSAYLCCETDEDADVDGRIFAFLHKTQMEYLAAAYLADAVNNKVLNFQSIDDEVMKTSEWRNHQEVIKFLAGHFAIAKTLKYGNKVSEIFSLLKKADVDYANYSFWWSFYLETLRNSNVGHIISNDTLPKCDWQLDEKQVLAGMKIYHSMPVKLESLRIDIPTNVDPHKIKNLLQVMQDIKKKKFNERKANNGRLDPVMVELHFWNHDEYEQNGPSDDFIDTLNPWGRLTNFTGSLGEKEVLSYSRKLKNIRVRLNSVAAVQAFKRSLSQIWKSVRIVRVTLGIPFTCLPSELCDFGYKGQFEITIKNVKDEHYPWLLEVLQQINGR